MSVLACCRQGCDNIMCTRYSSEYGYICNECFEELVDKRDINIHAFMNTPKTIQTKSPDMRTYYESVFPLV
jgi:hypothetical protein